MNGGGDRGVVLDRVVSKKKSPLDSPVRNAATLPDKRAMAHRMQTRRLWVFRSVMILSISAVLLCFLVMWRRDKLTVAGWLRALAKPVATLQAQVDDLGRLPASELELAENSLEFYASDADRYYASQVTQPVIIAYTYPIQRLMSENGRVVVIYDQGKIETQWMTASHFNGVWEAQEAAIEAFEQHRRRRLPHLP